MKRNFFLSVVLLSTWVTGFCTVWTVTNSGNTFTPATITIKMGDSVNFVLGSIHDAREVSEGTWNANGNTPLPGGFQTPFGGGMVLPSQLGIGTHFYVCSVHASMGMKGRIIVQLSTGVGEDLLAGSVSIYPNPSTGRFRLATEDPDLVKNGNIEIFDVRGQKIYQMPVDGPQSEIDLSNRPGGIYYLRLNNGKAVLTKKISLE